MFLTAYLYRRVSVLDVVLQVAHEHQVTGLIPTGVQSVVVNVAEDGAGTNTVGAIFGVDELAETIHDHSAVLPLTLFLIMLRLNRILKKTVSKSHLNKQQTGYHQDTFQPRSCQHPFYFKI